MAIVLLQSSSPPPASGVWANLIFIAGIILIFYFFFIRPEFQRRKKEKAFREGLKKGDKVITVGGIYGTIVEVKDKEVLLEVAKGTKLRVSKAAISAYAE